MVLALRIQWTKVGEPDSPVIIDDCITMNINKSTEIKNNLANLTLKNAHTKFRDVVTPTSTNIIGEYMDETTGSIMFSQDDEIRIWAKFLDDADDYSGTWWDDDSLIGAYTMQEHQLQTLENSSRIQLKAVDIAYILFNKIHTYSYGVANKWTAPGVIRHVCRFYGESETSSIDTQSGTDNDTGTSYIVKAKFVSEGGYIKDYRTTAEGGPSTTLNGAINDSDTTITLTSSTGFDDDGGTIVIEGEHISYTGISGNDLTGCTRGIDDTEAASHADTTAVYQGFPLVLLNKSWSPLFEWIGEMSQTENLNYLSEVTQGATPFYNRAYIFWVDKKNEAHWFYPDDTEDLTVELAEEGRRGWRLDKSVFEAVNFIIFNCGEDMYGNGITYYLFDETTDVTTLKMRYQPMTKIVHFLVNEDIATNSTRDTTNQDTLKQFPDAGEYPLTPTFLDDANKFRASIGAAARTNVTNDSEYNNCLREAAKWRGIQQAKKITTARTGLRYRGQLIIKGQNVNPGDLVSVTNGWVGLDSQLLRVLNVTHSINRNGWETTLEVQEDEKTIS